jgi:hypothetical protein
MVREYIASPAKKPRTKNSESIQNTAITKLSQENSCWLGARQNWRTALPYRLTSARQLCKRPLLSGRGEAWHPYRYGPMRAAEVHRRRSRRRYAAQPRARSREQVRSSSAGFSFQRSRSCGGTMAQPLSIAVLRRLFLRDRGEVPSAALNFASSAHSQPGVGSGKFRSSRT